LIRKTFKCPLSLIDSMDGLTKPDRGKAYLLFQYKGNADLKELNEKVTFTRARTDTPAGLELTLVKGINQFATEDDPELTALLDELEHPEDPKDSLTHGFKATFSDAGNLEVAKQVKEFAMNYFSQIYNVEERHYVEPILKLIMYKSETGEYIKLK